MNKFALFFKLWKKPLKCKCSMSTGMWVHKYESNHQYWHSDEDCIKYIQIEKCKCYGARRCHTQTERALFEYKDNFSFQSLITHIYENLIIEIISLLHLSIILHWRASPITEKQFKAVHVMSIDEEKKKKTMVEWMLVQSTH